MSRFCCSYDCCVYGGDGNVDADDREYTDHDAVWGLYAFLIYVDLKGLSR